MEVRTDIKVGQADAGLDIDTSILPLSHDPNQPLTLIPQQREYLSSLPPAAILRARILAYQKNNARLQSQAQSLRSQSSELESQLRKVVSLCTGVEESRIDEMIGGLCAAVESEGAEDVEVGRVRDFLRRIESVGESRNAHRADIGASHRTW